MHLPQYTRTLFEFTSSWHPPVFWALGQVVKRGETRTDCRAFSTFYDRRRLPQLEGWRGWRRGTNADDCERIKREGRQRRSLIFVSHAVRPFRCLRASRDHECELDDRVVDFVNFAGHTNFRQLFFDISCFWCLSLKKIFNFSSVRQFVKIRETWFEKTENQSTYEIFVPKNW